MALIRSYSQAKQDAIVADTVVSGAIIGDDLVVEREDASTDNLGTARGPKGFDGDVGDASQDDLADSFSVFEPSVWYSLTTLVTTYDGFSSVEWDDQIASAHHPPARYRRVNDVIEFGGLLRYTGTTPLTGGIFLTYQWPSQLAPDTDIATGVSYRNGRYVCPIFLISGSGIGYPDLWALGFQIPPSQPDMEEDEWISFNNVTIPLAP